MPLYSIKNIFYMMTHGMSSTRLYRIWGSMVQRCLNPKHVAFPRYEHRGIDPRWRVFANFAEDMGNEYEEHVALFGEAETTLERVQNSLGYSKANCRWATRKEQMNNTTRTVHVLVRGEKVSFAEAASKCGLEPRKLYARLKKYSVPVAMNMRIGSFHSKRMLDVGGQSLNLSGCAALLGISRERARQLHNKGFLLGRLKTLKAEQKA